LPEIELLPSPPDSASTFSIYGTGRNRVALWPERDGHLAGPGRDGHGFSDSYQSVKRFVRSLRGSQSPQARVIIETAAGEEDQVDYGTGPMVREAETGKYRRTRLFVMMLGYSCKAVRLLVFRSSARVWAELHEKAFRRLGGVTRVVVLDNLREGILAADIYDPRLADCAVLSLWRVELMDSRRVSISCGHEKKTFFS